MVYFGMFAGLLVSLSLIVLFENKLPFFIPIIFGVFLACRLAGKKEIFVSVSIAVLMNLTLFIFLCFSGLYENVAFRNREILRYLANFAIAITIGYGFLIHRRKGYK